MRRFYLYRRKRIFYAKLVDPKTGKALNGKSTHTTYRDEAAVIAMQWLKDGIPQEKREPRLIQDEASISNVISQLRSMPLVQSDVLHLHRLFLEESIHL